jgi:ketosteroid isomerase-like protein
MNPRMIVLSAAGLALTVASCQRQKAPTFTDADRAAVRALFDSTVVRVNAKNFTAWANQFTEDAPFMPPNHPIVRGRANLKAWADSLPPLTGFSFGDVTVDGEGDMAVGTSSYAMTFNPPGAPPTADKGKQLVIFHRQADGSWLVTAGAFSSDLPLPSVGPPPPAAVKK